MSFKDLEIGICAHQKTTQNIYIGFHRRYEKLNQLNMF